MQSQFFIGIDVSKAKLDAFLFGKGVYKQFSNSRKGFDAMVLWIKKSLPISDLSPVMICFEHTGIYSLPLSLYLAENSVPFSMTSALQIKRSMGIARGKNDRIDAKRIAEYAFRHRDTLQQTQLPPKAILKLQPLLTLRDRLVRNRAGYEATKGELFHFLSEKDFPELSETYDNLIAELKEKIKKLEKAITAIITSDEELNKTFSLIRQIKGVGLIISAYMIACTHNFTRFENWRKFACYAGIAPFEFQSGTSLQAKPRVNNLANKQIKKLLHIAAMHAAYNDKDLGVYFRKRTEAGYHKMSTLNAVRNKVLARIFAVAKRKTPYLQQLEPAA